MSSFNETLSDLDEVKRLAERHGLGEPIFDEAYEEEGIQDMLLDLGVIERERK